ncbi:MAG: CPBP family intramembrane metalloprotease [Acidobacteria bacterium]|nr:CPBP family intramembrane metalloprotease [Acidobacteriota bacterium]
MLIFFVAFALLGVLVIGLVESLLNPSGTPDKRATPTEIAVPAAISTVLALVLGWGCARLFEKLPFRSLGAAFTRRWLLHFGAGWLVGGIAFAIALMTATVSGGIHLSLNRLSSENDITTTLLSTLAVLAVGAASEESLFRGYLLQTLLRSGHVQFAVAGSAFLFASVHFANPDFSGLSWFNTLVAGVWFAVAYLKTRDLWFPFGIHFAWNWLQGPVFGISISGIAGFGSAPLMRATDTGPAWLTGGNYGIEGGLACTFALILSTILVWYMPGIRADQELLALTSVRQPGS